MLHKRRIEIAPPCLSQITDTRAPASGAIISEISPSVIAERASLLLP